MILVFETASGSTYEIDQEAKKIRRVMGARAPQPRQGRDGEWRAYRDVSPLEIGDPVFIYWPKATTPLLEGSPPDAEPATRTAPVVRIAVRVEA